jgi:hypothetical protein
MSVRGSQVEGDDAVKGKADSAQNDLADRKRTQALLSAQRRSLQLIAAGASLTEVLQDLCDTIDAQAPANISTVLLMDGDGERLFQAAGRRVPEGWTQTITPPPIGPQRGSCGTTALYVPSIALAISGDCVYNNTHLYLAECDEGACREWLRALDQIEPLHPKVVVAGHGVLDPDSSPRHIEETRRYLRDFIASLARSSTAIGLYETMLSFYPNRNNSGSLWAAARASKPTPSISNESRNSTL